MEGFTPDVDDYSTVNGIPRKVVCAANRYGDIIITGIRHHCPIMRQNMRAFGSIQELRLRGKEEQGFVDQWGNFMDRKQAMNIIKKFDQPNFNSDRNGCSTYLFSEGLY